MGDLEDHTSRHSDRFSMTTASLLLHPSPSPLQQPHHQQHPVITASQPKCMRHANKRRRYNITPSLIGWAYTQNHPCVRSQYYILQHSGAWIKWWLWCSRHFQMNFFKRRFNILIEILQKYIPGSIVYNKSDDQAINRTNNNLVSHKTIRQHDIYCNYVIAYKANTVTQYISFNIPMP